MMDDLRCRVRSLQTFSDDDDSQSKKLESMSLNVNLRDYQLFGVKWLVSSHGTVGQHGCILGDEMGLGKTVQVMIMS